MSGPVPSGLEPFGCRLRRAMDERGPLCAGIDPLPELLFSWGLTDDAAGLREFSVRAVDALAPAAAMVKPQSAFFERHGSAGIAVLEDVIARSRAAGALVLVDAKRGDIGSTMQGYADAYLDQFAPLACDALTVSPYLGFGSLAPVFEMAATQGAGVFVLARTSNPEGSQVQLACNGDRSVSAEILDAIAAANAGTEPMGSIGAVVAANLASPPEGLAINGPLLAPGYGAQGGAASDLARVFGEQRDLVIPATSRGLLRFGPEQPSLRRAFAEAVRDVTNALQPLSA
jgi:orotidine-5'-phosphate decarboxylase